MLPFCSFGSIFNVLALAWLTLVYVFEKSKWKPLEIFPKRKFHIKTREKNLVIVRNRLCDVVISNEDAFSVDKVIFLRNDNIPWRQPLEWDSQTPPYVWTSISSAFYNCTQVLFRQVNTKGGNIPLSSNFSETQRCVYFANIGTFPLFVFEKKETKNKTTD